MSSPSIDVTYNIVPPTTVPKDAYSSLEVTNTHSIALEPAQSSLSNPPHHLSNPPFNQSPTHDAHYTALLHALRDTQAYTNTVLTGWKDAIGNEEKVKENVQVDQYGHKKKGMGKAMMMVRAAKEDGEEKGIGEEGGGAEESEEEDDEDELDGVEDA